MKSPIPKEQFRAMHGWAFVGKTFIIALVCWGFLLHFATKTLMKSAPFTKADWIVVLGGESGERVIGAAELYRDGVAPQIFVSGRGDCNRNVHLLEIAGVPAANISHECTSGSTYENAMYTKQFLSTSNPQKVILVTSWFHTARALRVFEHEWPETQFGTYGVAPNDESYYRFPIAESGVITIEYLKSAWYLFRYGLI